MAMLIHSSILSDFCHYASEGTIPLDIVDIRIDMSSVCFQFKPKKAHYVLFSNNYLIFAMSQGWKSSARVLHPIIVYKQRRLYSTEIFYEFTI